MANIRPLHKSYEMALKDVVLPLSEVQAAILQPLDKPQHQLHLLLIPDCSEGGKRNCKVTFLLNNSVAKHFLILCVKDFFLPCRKMSPGTSVKSSVQGNRV